MTNKFVLYLNCLILSAAFVSAKGDFQSLLVISLYLTTLAALFPTK